MTTSATAMGFGSTPAAQQRGRDWEENET